MWSVAPPSATHLPSSRYRIFGLPHLVCFPFRPYPPPPPPPPHLLIPWSPLPVRVPGEAGESVRGGGVEGGKLRNVSPFDLRGGGMCWFNYLFLPLEIQLRRFGVRNSTCVLEGGEKRRGQNTDFRGVALLIPLSCC